MPVSPRCHHRHHAPQANYVDANHAIHLPLVAMPMATFRLPRRWQRPAGYAVMKPESMPRNLGAQARRPLSRRKAWDGFVGRDDAG